MSYDLLRKLSYYTLTDTIATDQLTKSIIWRYCDVAATGNNWQRKSDQLWDAIDSFDRSNPVGPSVPSTFAAPISFSFWRGVRRLTKNHTLPTASVITYHCRESYIVATAEQRPLFAIIVPNLFQSFMDSVCVDVSDLIRKLFFVLFWVLPTVSYRTYWYGGNPPCVW